MKINGIIAGKLTEMDTVLLELRSLDELSHAALKEDWRTRRAVERDLQVLTEIVIDVCQRIISLAGLQPPPTSAEAIEQCQHLGVIQVNPNYKLMVQFRNFIVHRYESVDVDILCDIVNNRLVDFETFKKDVLEYAKRN